MDKKFRLIANVIVLLTFGLKFVLQAISWNRELISFVGFLMGSCKLSSGRGLEERGWANKVEPACK